MGYQQNSHLWRSQKFWSDCGFLKMQIVLVLFALTKFVLSDNAGQGVDTETLEKYVAENKAELAENKAELAENKTELAEIKAELAENKAELAENKAELAQLRMEIAELRNDVIGCQAGTAYIESSTGWKWKKSASFTFEREFKSKPSLMVAVRAIYSFKNENGWEIGVNAYAPEFYLDEAHKVDLKEFSVRYYIDHLKSSDRSVMLISYMACGRM